MTYLSPTSPANGALRVLPASHHGSFPLHASLPEAHSKAAEELDPSEPAMQDAPSQVTIAVAAGDAVAIDYRLLHGTRANLSAARRDCVLLTFVPSWIGLPADLKGHLIQHPALPSAEERRRLPPHFRSLLPSFNRPRVDLRLNRHVPARFRVSAD